MVNQLAERKKYLPWEVSHSILALKTEKLPIIFRSVRVRLHPKLLWAI